MENLLEQEIKGQFYLANNIDKKLLGVLKIYDNNESFLELLGSFIKSDLADINSKNQFILGETKNGPITLICNTVHFRDYSNIFESKLKIDHLIFNQHFISINNIEFDGLCLEFSHLAYWFDDGFMDRKKKFSKLIYNLSNLKISCEIDPSYSLNPDSLIRPRKLFTDNTFIKIKSSSKLKFLDILYYIKLIHHFFCFILNKKIKLIKLFLIIDNNYCEIIYDYRQNLKIDTSINKFLVLYNNENKLLRNIFKKWFVSYQNIPQLHDLYFSTFFNSTLTVESGFILNMQVFEGIMRYKLKYNGDHLDHILKQYSIIFPNIVTSAISLYSFKTHKVKDFLNKVRKTRNYFAHRNIKDISDAFMGYDLFKLFKIIEGFNKILLLNEIDYSEKEILAILPVIFKF